VQSPPLVTQPARWSWPARGHELDHEPRTRVGFPMQPTYVPAMGRAEIALVACVACVVAGVVLGGIWLLVLSLVGIAVLGAFAQR
jgi:hypothetical protein